MEPAQDGGVPRQPEEPTREQVLAAMEACEPYTVKDFEGLFENTSRWTIQRRLDHLHDEGEIRKKKHGGTKVTYWIED
jgi:hypothetical protein